jgi:hypothetical protein
MRLDRRFPIHVAAVLAGGLGVAGVVLAGRGSPDVVFAVALGAFLSTLNVFVGFLAIEYAFEKSYTTFVKTVLGGMAVRMVFLLGAMALAITQFHVHAAGLVLGTLGFYAAYLVVEIIFIQRKVSVKNEGR